MAEESKVGEDEIEEEDRISNLPDGVLIHILSFLPTKSAVTTSHLSRRWRNLWQHLSVLNFSDDSHEYVHDHSERFRNFALLVNGVLTLLRNPRGIRKMTLECAHSLMDDKFRAYSIETWVRAVIGPHLQELDLDIDLISADNIPAFNLPQNFFFTCTNLVSLSLSSAIHIHLQSSTPVTLPSLKKLLIDILYVEVPSLNALLCGCSNIEILDLCFSAQSLDKICIPTSLKWLKIAIENDVGAYLEMNTPDLEYLHINGVKFGKVFSMYNLHKVVEAYLDVFPQSFSSVIPLHDLLSALSGTKHLVLSYSTTKWLLGEPHDLLFQEFRYLLHLELILPSVNSNSILSLLQKCPMLQALLIQNDEEQSPILGWAPQSSTVPNCLGSHLTFIQIKGFQGFPDEVSFVEHVLQKGLVLRTMIIGDISLDLDINKKYDILKRLSNVPRASGMCQLTFD